MAGVAIETITVDPSLESVAVLGILVFVRTLLSFSLDIEVEGVAPWRRAVMEERQAAEHPEAGRRAHAAGPRLDERWSPLGRHRSRLERLPT